jgi:3-isopropylmalate/(R)-2-methylmalate dehydratase large subunit
VTSAQAFEGLRIHGRQPRRPEANLAVPDHNVPTSSRSAGITDPVARLQVDTLGRNCAEFGITIYGMDDPRQGIVHVIGPEAGFTLPGTTMVCGDSHTPPMGPSGPWPSASGPRRSSMYSPHAAWCSASPSPCSSAWTGPWGRASPPKT